MKATSVVLFVVLIFFSSVNVSCHLDTNRDYDQTTNEQ